MTTPAIPQFIAGSGPQQADMQNLWVTNLQFFQKRVVFRANQNTTPTTLPSSGAITTIAYDNVIEDPYSGWNASTHRWTAPPGLSGWYQVTITVWVTGPGATLTVLSTYAGTVAGNGQALSDVVMPSAATGAGEGVLWVYLTGGQDFAYGAAAIQNSASNVSTSVGAGRNSSIEILWLLG